MKIGLSQLLLEGGEPKRNFERAELDIIKASSQGCDIVLLPETIDFCWTHPSFTNAKPIPGEHSDYFCFLAQKYSIWVCVGLTEKTINGYKNTAILIDSKGEIKIKYSKINLIDVEKPFYQKGNSLGVVESPWGKIGVNICADNYLESTHIGHTLASMDADIILSPSSWTVDHYVQEDTDPYKDKWVKPLTEIATKNNITIINCTSVGYILGGPYEGKKMVGCSLAINKRGVLFEGDFCEFSGGFDVIEI